MEITYEEYKKSGCFKNEDYFRKMYDGYFDKSYFVRDDIIKNFYLNKEMFGDIAYYNDVIIYDEDNNIYYQVLYISRDQGYWKFAREIKIRKRKEIVPIYDEIDQKKLQIIDMYDIEPYNDLWMIPYSNLELIARNKFIFSFYKNYNKKLTRIKTNSYNLYYREGNPIKCF